MRSLSARREAFNARVQELQALTAAQGLAHWDMQTGMPPQASATRARTLSALGALAHERLIDPAFGDTLQALHEAAPKDPPNNPLEAGVLAEMIYRYERARCLSPDWVRRFEETSAQGYAIWVDARRTRDFAAFAPTLRTLVALARERADRLRDAGAPGTRPDGTRYDALLEDYERGATVAQLDPVFEALRDQLVPMRQAILARQARHVQYGDAAEDCFAGHVFDDAAQTAFCRMLLTTMGYDFTRGRLDASVHPFTSEIGGRTDVRLTIRATPDHPLESVFTALHEGGHALYEQGIAEELDETPLGNGTSLGMHESQSRLWENLVGRSPAFWAFAYPHLQAAFGPALADVSLARFLRRVNRVRPSLIRTEADEVTYNLHILLRYDLEKALINGDMAVEEIPQAWNAAMHTLLGVDVPHDGDGCLQDVHWSGGMFGYFPTYTLGNLYAAQFWQAAHRAMPDLDARMTQGDLLSLRQWLQESIHRHGKRLTADDLALAVTGETLNPRYFIDTLRARYLPDAV